MKQYRTILMALAMSVVALLPGVAYADNPSETVVPEVDDVTDSGCTDRTRAGSFNLVMTKEGDVLTCEVQGIIANCGLDYFDVRPEYSKSAVGPDTLFLTIMPVVSWEKDCTCPYNVTFTVRNVSEDSFFLNCWRYTGMVSFTESGENRLEFGSEKATIDGAVYYLYKPGYQAMITRSSTDGAQNEELVVPSTVSYEGENYTVGAFRPEDFLSSKEVKKLILPSTIFRSDGTGEFYNCFNGNFPKLETIEVEPNSHLFSSVGGVLYSSDGRSLYCHPGSNSRTEYTVIDGVETIARMAFVNSTNLKSIRLPESVTAIKPYAFSNCKSLESIYIPVRLDRANLYNAFSYMESTPTLYVPESDVDYYKTIYKGPVLPLSSYGQSLGVSAVGQPAAVQAESFDLQGRRVQGEPQKGVYVSGGRKYVVR